MTDAQLFPLAYIHNNPTPLYPYSEVIFIELVVRESLSTIALIWMCFDYEHTSYKAFKALSSNAIVHLPPPTWTCLV